VENVHCDETIILEEGVARSSMTAVPANGINRENGNCHEDGKSQSALFTPRDWIELSVTTMTSRQVPHWFGVGLSESLKNERDREKEQKAEERVLQVQRPVIGGIANVTEMGHLVIRLLRI
jgi:hypothetical protein